MRAFELELSVLSGYLVTLFGVVEAFFRGVMTWFPKISSPPYNPNSKKSPIIPPAKERFELVPAFASYAPGTDSILVLEENPLQYLPVPRAPNEKKL
jgi:hypothetical protein